MIEIDPRRTDLARELALGGGLRPPAEPPPRRDCGGKAAARSASDGPRATDRMRGAVTAEWKERKE
jgi:hypothetical protein